MENSTASPWQRTSTWCFLTTIGVVTILAINFRDQSRMIITEPDEGAWIYSGYFYNLAFLKRDLQSPDWKHPDCLDHPPVAKYLFGAVAASDGYIVDSPKLKQWWFDTSFHMHPRDMNRIMQSTIPDSTLYRGRLVCTVLFAATCIVLFWISARAFAPWTAALAAMLLAACPIVLDFSAKIMSAAPFCLLLLLLLRSQIGWLKHCGDGIRKVGWRAICIGLLIAVLANTKLNGLTALPCVMCVIACGLLVRFWHAPGSNMPTTSRLLADVLVSTVLVATSFLIAAIIINPSLYSEPITFVQGMFDRRWNEVEFQMLAYYMGSLQTWPLVLAGVVRGLFFTNDWLYQWWSIPGLMFFFLLGISAVPGIFARDRHTVLVILINFALWGGATAYTYRMAWERYLLPIFPFVMLLAAAGVWQSIRMVRDSGPPARRVASVSLAVIVTAILCWFQSQWTIGFYLDNDPAPLVEAYRKAMLKRPDRAGGYIRYAEVLFLFQNKVDEAEPICRQGLELNPDFAEGHHTMGSVLIAKNQLSKGLAHLRRSLELHPVNASALATAADTLLTMDRLDAQAGQPPTTTARLDEAVRFYYESIRLSPNRQKPLMRLALILAAYPDPQSRRPRQALDLAHRAAAAANGKNASVLTALAVANASAGNFDQAIVDLDQALALLEGMDSNSHVVETLRESRKRFQNRQPALPPEHYRHLTFAMQ